MRFLPFLFCLPLFASEWLVLRSGKTVICDQYRRDNGKVQITVGKQSYSLPDATIDWEKTELKKQAETQKSAELQKAMRDKELEAQAASAAVKPRKEIILSTSDMKSMATSQISGPVQIPYRVVGNNLIVDVLLNGTHVYPFILDTGASISTINPYKYQGTPLERTNEEVELGGVGGSSGRKAIVILQSVALGKASIKRFPMVSVVIPLLDSSQTIGLLGQDFLNNFVVTIDNLNHTVTLKAHSNSQAVASDGSLPPAQTVLNNLNDLIDETERLSNRYFNSGQATSSSMSTRLRQISSDLELNDRHWRSYLERWQEKGIHDSPDKSSQELAKMINCRYELSDFISRYKHSTIELAQLCSLPRPTELALSEFLDQYQRARKAYQAFRECLN